MNNNYNNKLKVTGRFADDDSLDNLKYNIISNKNVIPKFSREEVDLYCSSPYTNNPKSYEYIIYGTTMPNRKILFWAANPRTVWNPYPFKDYETAYLNTTNKGVVTSDESGNFKIMINYPNSHYLDNGKKYIAPHLNVTVCNGNKIEQNYRIQLPEKPNDKLFLRNFIIINCIIGLIILSYFTYKAIANRR